MTPDTSDPAPPAMQTPSAAQGWTLSLAGPQDTDEIVRLARQVYGTENLALNADYWNWRFHSERAFAADIVCARRDGQLIGVVCSQTFPFQWASREFKGRMLVSGFTHPDCRGQGLFQAIVGHATQGAARGGALFTMGMPNDQALGAYLKTRAWRYVGRVPLFLKLASASRTVRWRWPGSAVLDGISSAAFRRAPLHSEGRLTRVEPMTRVPESLSELSDEFSRCADRLMIRRDATYWNWRYATKPDAPYRILVAHAGVRLAGAVVTSVSRFRHVPVGMIVDLVTCGGEAMVRRLLRAAETDLVRRGLGVVACQATSPLLSDALRREGYRCPDSRWLPKKFHYILNMTGLPGLPHEPAAMGDWHLTFGDHDTV